eukprot:COSAG02_NODE_61668_length_268_cov_0.603550_1_plen_45_part_01
MREAELRSVRLRAELGVVVAKLAAESLAPGVLAPATGVVGSGSSS